MEERIATIFNNVMGPIGVGPSTSNTCGPCRIGYLSRLIAGETLKQVRIRFPSDSGYATPNAYGMRSDYAFAHGVAGNLPDADAPLLEAYRELEKQGISLEYSVSNQISSHGEHLLDIMELVDDQGNQTEVWGISKGGGAIEIIRINGFSVSITGAENLLLIYTDQGEKAQSLRQTLCGLYPELAEYSGQLSVDGDKALLLLPMYRIAPERMLARIAAMEGVTKVTALPAILPVVVRSNVRLPFKDADELTRYCAEGRSLVQAAVDYESAVSGWSPEQIRGFAAKALKSIRSAIHGGLNPSLQFDGIIPPSASKMIRNAQAGIALEDGIVSKAALYALAIMEYSNASGVVVCMPTAGASGTVGGALAAAAEKLGASDQQVEDALLAAGAVGVSITEDNDFCGGVYGCQAEVGCASAMAAAGLVTLAGGRAEEAINAASMALQNMLGLICDPVCGLVQVPCFARNMAGVSNAVVCANMSMLGFPAVIPLQDTFQAMKRSGEILPMTLRGCGGGLAETKTGKCLLHSYYNK